MNRTDRTAQPSKRRTRGNLHTERPLLACMRRYNAVLRAIAIVVTVAFLNVYLQPLVLAARLPSPPAPQAPSNEEKLAKHLEKIQDNLDRLDQKLAAKQDAKNEAQDLKTLRQDLDTLDRQAIEDFNKIEQHLKDKKLPTVILDRHSDAVKQYQQEMAALKANLDDFDRAEDTDKPAKAKQAREHLSAKHKKRGPKTKFDPNDLPNKSLQPNPKNKPKQNKADFIRAGLYDNPTVKVASHGSFRIDQLPGAFDPAYLAATTEVVLTSAIRAKAAELEHNPVKIYNWVRNNVEWLPTWGATQDADITLGGKRGNAIDIASLLIALLRASDIPARYVHGTIELPEEKFRDWAGGFTNIMAAVNFTSSGGIPITTIIGGGKITKVQLEHLWVEAAIDFQPSRGAINKSADSWVQLDPSYKQYEELTGIDVVAVSGIDPDALAQSFVSSGTVNEQEGWAQNLNPAILQNAQTQMQAALEQHIRDGLPNPTVGDVIGGRSILTTSSSVLPTNLPNRLILTGARYAAIPQPLQNSMTLAFGFDVLREPINPIAFPWAKLNNHKVTLSFRAANEIDEQALASLLPQGGITDPSQLPSSIPSYLISVIPEIALDGQVIGQGNAMRLGEELEFFYEVYHVGSGAHTYTYKVPAGSYLNVMAAGGSVSARALHTLRAELQDTHTVLQTGNDTAIGALTREDILGDAFHAGALGYFGEYIALSRLSGGLQNASHSLPQGYGTFGYEPNVQTFFGFPRAIERGGVAVNVRLSYVILPRDGDMTRFRDLNLQTGKLSSELEHGVPEQMFRTPEQPAEGVSAIKALQIAAQQGQRIYHITLQNHVQVMPNLHLDGLAMSEITQALATGKEVITHTDRISVPGFIGEGYVLFDPVTGGGAYKITGGKNGGFLKTGASVANPGLFMVDWCTRNTSCKETLRAATAALKQLLTDPVAKGVGILQKSLSLTLLSGEYAQLIADCIVSGVSQEVIQGLIAIRTLLYEATLLMGHWFASLTVGVKSAVFFSFLDGIIKKMTGGLFDSLVIFANCRHE